MIGAGGPPPVTGGPTTKAQKRTTWLAAKGTKGRQFSRGAFTFTLLDDLTVTTTAAGTPVITLNLGITRDGVDVTPPDLNPIVIVNPPLAVRAADGTPTLNPATALRDIVLDILKGYR